jgi:hypothetical protein
MNYQDALIVAHALRLDDWDESAHPREPNGQFGSEGEARDHVHAINQAHKDISARYENHEGQHRVAVVMTSANGKLATTKDLKGPVDPRKLVNEMKGALKAERAERARPKDNWAPVRRKIFETPGFK